MKILFLKASSFLTSYDIRNIETALIFGHEITLRRSPTTVIGHEITTITFDELGDISETPDKESPNA